MSPKPCVHHPDREATHRAGAALLCDACATRIASRLEREHQRQTPRPLAGRLFGNEPT